MTKEIKTNHGGFYSYLKSKTSLKDEVSRLKDGEGGVTSDTQESCNVLNRKFHKVFTEEAKDPVPEVGSSFKGHRIGEIDFSMKDVEHVLKEL